MTLAQFITDKTTGRLKFGALARVSEHLGVTKNTVKKWYRGEWTPCAETQARIRAMIRARIPLAPRAMGRPRMARANGDK